MRRCPDPIADDVHRTLLEQHRPALVGHCYRMLGIVVDAEDAVQEGMLRVWKGLESSSLENWLYRIATRFASTPSPAAIAGASGRSSCRDSPGW